MKYPQSCINFGYPVAYNFCFFSPELCKAIQWWQKETGIKFTGKLRNSLFTRKPTGYHYLKREIHIFTSEVFLLFHELQHYVQSKHSPLKLTYTNWYKFCCGKPNDPHNISYVRLPTEADANRNARRLTLKFLKRPAAYR